MLTRTGKAKVTKSTVRGGPRFCTSYLFIAFLLLIPLTHWQLAIGIDQDRMLATLQRLGGTPPQFREWQKLVSDASQLNTPDKLKRVNEFFNRRIQFGEDQQVWGQSDYWATPMETLAKGKGDCEDFTIAKYFTLLSANVPNEQLRLVYVKAKLGGTLTQAHMVLAYYATPDAEPLILDNLITDIRPASRRPDLLPVFSFNNQGIWDSSSTATAATGTLATSVPSNNSGGSNSGIGRLSRWQDLVNRAKAEGFEF